MPDDCVFYCRKAPSGTLNISQTYHFSAPASWAVRPTKGESRRLSAPVFLRAGAESGPGPHQMTPLKGGAV